ncbi:MAG: SNF2-related protein [Comamonadaceae bacterium]|nr:SNF2-related protein [Comamonadaceae bacterium]
MGLGKTIQVLSLLLVLKREHEESRPSLLVAPASLLANWAAEAERFAPGLRLLIAHPSELPAAQLRALEASRLERRRSGDHQLRLSAALAGAGRHAVAGGRTGRSAGDQEPGREADAAGEEAERTARALR